MHAIRSLQAHLTTRQAKRASIMATSPQGPLKKWLTVALFSVLIASFALWGVGDIFRGGGGQSWVIKAGEATVSQRDFARSFQRQFSQMRQSFGGQLNMETARQMGLVDRITQQIANRALFDAHAKDMNLLVGEQQLLERITEQQAFQNDQGEFVRARFETALQRSGMSEDAYTELLRTDIHRQNLLAMVTSGIRAPRVMAERLFMYQNERRIGRYAVVGDQSFRAGEPSEPDLRSFYKNHDAPFMAPPYREVTLIHLTPAQFTAEVKVTEDELRQAYERRKDAFTKAETRHLQQIVFNERAKAAQAVQRLRGGADIDTVAKDLTGGAAVDLGPTKRDDLLESLRERVFSAEGQSVVGPVESGLGWHVVEIGKVEAGTVKTFDAVRDQLRQDIAEERAVDTLVSLANNLDDQLASGATLEEAASNLGLETRHIAAVDQQGRNRDGDSIPNLPEKSTFLETVFDTERGNKSLLKETQDGGYFVVRVDSVTPEQKRPFSAVETKVGERWKQAQRRQEAREAAEKLRDSIKNGTDFTQAATLVGVEVQTTPPLARQGNQNASAAEKALAGAFFDAEPGAAVVTEIDRGVVVGELTEVRTPNPQENQQQLARIEQQVQQGVRSTMLQQYVNALRERYQLRINQTQMDRVLEQIR
jgi:peptidyl-prolyl cis-trans isomerase D